MVLKWLSKMAKKKSFWAKNDTWYDNFFQNVHNNKGNNFSLISLKMTSKGSKCEKSAKNAFSLYFLYKTPIKRK